MALVMGRRGHKPPGDPARSDEGNGLIRLTEARAAAPYSGVHPDRIHFLDLPFYETGRVRENPIGPEDVAITAKLLDEVKPHQIYAAGDLSDPHGIHRVCLAGLRDLALPRRLAGMGAARD